MSMMHGARREINRLRARIAQEDQDFRAGAPAVDEDGLPCWDGGVPLTIEEFMKALGASPDEELTPEELEVRDRLSPYMHVFANLDKPSEGAP